MSFKDRDEIISYFDKEYNKKEIKNVFLFIATRGGKTKISNSIANRMAEEKGAIKILITLNHLLEKSKKEDYKDFKILSYNNFSSKNFGKKLRKEEKERDYNKFFYEITENKPYVVVLDECHSIKSLNTAYRKLIIPFLALSSGNIFLTGTPMGNNSLEYLQLLILGIENDFNKYKGNFFNILNQISPFNLFGNEIKNLKLDTQSIFKNNKDKKDKREEHAIASLIINENIAKYDDSFIIKTGKFSKEWFKNDEKDFFQRCDFKDFNSKGYSFIKELEANTIILKMTENDAEHYDYSNYENIFHEVNSKEFDLFLAVKEKVINDDNFRNKLEAFLKIENLVNYLESIINKKELKFKLLNELGQITVLERLNSSSIKHEKLKEILGLYKNENIIIWTSYHEERIELIKKFGFLDGSKQENRLKYEVDGGIIVMSMLSNAEGLNWHHGRIAIFLSPNHSSTAFTQARARTMGFEQKEKVINHIIFTKEERKLKDKMLEKYEFNKNMKV